MEVLGNGGGRREVRKCISVQALTCTNIKNMASLTCGLWVCLVVLFVICSNWTRCMKRHKTSEMGVENWAAAVRGSFLPCGLQGLYLQVWNHPIQTSSRWGWEAHACRFQEDQSSSPVVSFTQRGDGEKIILLFCSVFWFCYLFVYLLNFAMPRCFSAKSTRINFSCGGSTTFSPFSDISNSPQCLPQGPF